MPRRDPDDMTAGECIEELIHSFDLTEAELASIMDELTSGPKDGPEMAWHIMSVFAKHGMSRPAKGRADNWPALMTRRGRLFTKAYILVHDEQVIERPTDGTHRMVH